MGIVTSILFTAAFLAGDDGTLLIPMSVAEPRPGRFGSLWQTEIKMHNSGDKPLQVSVGVDPFGFPYPIATLAPNEVRTVVINRPAGLQGNPDPVPAYIIHVPPEQLRDLAVNVRVFDISRTALTLGTEVPVIRNFAEKATRAPLRLLNIPLDPRFRTSLKVYLLDGAIDRGVQLQIIDEDSGTALHSRTVYPQLANRFTLGPLYLEVADVREAFGLSSDRVMIVIAPTHEHQRVWAMSSITNNETQQVTLVTPQPAN